MSWSAVTSIVSNIFLSIVLVLLNKRVVVKFEFTFMTVLSSLHFAMSFVVCMVMICTRVQKYKAVNSFWSIFRISLGSLMSIVFMNYCLSQSTVGFYQVAKLFCIPLTLLFESIFGMRQEELTWQLLLSLLIIIVGMTLVIREEISTNWHGFVWGVCGVVTTALSQVFFAPLKKGLGLDSFQLLFHTSPWLTFGTFLVVPCFEDVNRLIEYELTGSVMLNLFLTCLVAAAFNLSNYIVLSEISPLSYNITGHIKTIIIIGMGSYLFKTAPSAVMLVGLLIAVIGVVAFSIEKERQVANTTATQSSAASIGKMTFSCSIVSENRDSLQFHKQKHPFSVNEATTATTATDIKQTKQNKTDNVRKQHKRDKLIEGFLRV